MTYEGRGRKKTVASSKNGSKKEAVKLIIAASLTAAAAVTRFMFPAELAQLRMGVLDAVSVSIPYREAVSALGSALSGKESITVAAKRAWTIATGESGSEPVETLSETDPLEVKAEEKGRVISVGESLVFGKYVVVRGESGDKIYDGLAEIIAEEGAYVDAGELLGSKKAQNGASES